MFDREGNPSVFLAWAENDWIAQAEIVADESGPVDLLKRMATRESMPVFWPHLAFRPDADFSTLTPQTIPDWEDAFYCWSRIDSKDLGLNPLTFARWRSDWNQRARA
jgi:hypothetical protein